MICSSLALALGLFLFDSVQTPFAIYLSTLLIGTGGGVLNSETIAVISDISDDSKRGTMLSILGASYCVGSLVWTLSCRVFIIDYSVPVVWSAALIALYCAAFSFVRFPQAKIKGGESVPLWKSFSFLKYRLIAVTAFLLFFEGMAEAVCSNYTTTYLSSFGEAGIPAEVALTSLIFMTAGMMAGRFTLPVCLRSGGPVVSYYLFLSIALAGTMILFFMYDSPLAAFAAMTALGFGIGVTAPVVFSYIGEVFRKYSGTVIALVIVVAQAGMILGNYLAGKLFTGSAISCGVFRIFPFFAGALFIMLMLLFPLVVKGAAYTKKQNLDL